MERDGEGDAKSESVGGAEERGVVEVLIRALAVNSGDMLSVAPPVARGESEMLAGPLAVAVAGSVKEGEGEGCIDAEALKEGMADDEALAPTLPVKLAH